MTPDERLLRDAWIAEMWRPVPEAGRARMVGGVMCKGCGIRLEKVGKKGRPRLYCPTCRPVKRAS